MLTAKLMIEMIVPMIEAIVPISEKLMGDYDLRIAE
jgi:hypothetical protein